MKGRARLHEKIYIVSTQDQSGKQIASPHVPCSGVNPIWHGAQRGRGLAEPKNIYSFFGVTKKDGPATSVPPCHCQTEPASSSHINQPQIIPHPARGTEHSPAPFLHPFSHDWPLTPATRLGCESPMPPFFRSTSRTGMQWRGHRRVFLKEGKVTTLAIPGQATKEHERQHTLGAMSLREINNNIFWRKS